MIELLATGPCAQMREDFDEGWCVTLLAAEEWQQVQES
jgi:hypothetical protein